MTLDGLLTKFKVDNLSEDGEEEFQQGVAPIARLARFGRRADATEEALHLCRRFRTATWRC